MSAPVASLDVDWDPAVVAVGWFFVGARYSGAHTRKQLLKDKDFRREYAAAKQRIREMSVRWVQESDPVKQALLEIYVVVVLQTPYNNFDTH